MAFHTRSLQDLQRIILNNVNCIVRLASVTPSSKFRLRTLNCALSSIEKFEDKYSQDVKLVSV